MRRVALALLMTMAARVVPAADHNDPNSINSIFADIDVSPADLYDMFGWPSDDGGNVILALTFASVPATGVFDPDMLYRIKLVPKPRVAHQDKDWSLQDFLQYADALKERYRLKGPEVRVRVDGRGQAQVDFIDFPGGSFTKTVSTNQVVTVETPAGAAIQLYIGGRDDAFFNDLPGFFRSINYAPQFYKVPLAATVDREIKIPKTLLELEGNSLFNYDPSVPQWGRPGGFKRDLPPAPYTWTGNRFAKDAEGRYRFVYSGVDAQAGFNINAVILEIPLGAITRNPDRDRVVDAWGESWIRKAAHRIPTIPDEPRRGFFGAIGGFFRGMFGGSGDRYQKDLARYKLVDTDGVPFADAGLSEREDDRQLGAANLKLARTFVRRLGHLGWGFGPSISALGVGTCFDHDGAPVSVYRTYALAVEAFPRAKKCLFQPMNMPDDSWNKKHLNIPLRRPFEIFIPNVNAIDMDTTGTWPFGRRLEDQVATRFLSVFLDMRTGCHGGPCNVETLGQQALWDSLPITPRTPPNPLHNDKPFLDHFPYLADPW
jgi:uncharacterized protein DUF4331